MSDTAFKERIRQAINIVDVIADYVSLKPSGRDFVGLCPFHKDKRPSLTVSSSKQIFKCFACGAGGDVFSFVQRRENVTFPEAIRLLADRAGLQPEPPHDRTGGNRTGGGDGVDRTALAAVNAWAVDHFRGNLDTTEEGKRATDYITGRGISDDVRETFRLGLALDSYENLLSAGRKQGFDEKLLAAAGLVKPRREGDGHYDTFRNRVMFPIAEATGRTIGFGGRTLGEDPAKYLNTPETTLFSKGRHLYGLDLARRALGEKGRAIIVEGYTDVIMAHQFGFLEAVATLGTALTEAHVQLLRRYTETVILLFDADEAGRKAADRALPAALDGRLDVRIAFLPQGTDPCDTLLAHGADGFEQILGSAVDAFEYKWSQVQATHAGGVSAAAKRSAIESFLDALLAASRGGTLDAIDLGLRINRLSPLLGLPADTLHGLLAERTRRAGRSSHPSRPSTSGSASENRNTRDGAPLRRSAEQAALIEMLEILITEPGYYNQVDELFKPDRLQERGLALIAQRVVHLAETLGEFSVVELLSGFEDPALCDRITGLQAAGERCGRHQERLEAAAETIRREAQRRSTSEVGRSLLDHDAQQSDPQAVENALRRLQEGAQSQHYFAPRKVLR